MNETILNGLLNLFAIFASLAKIGGGQARQAVNAYLTSHFGIRSHKEYMELFEEIQTVYEDPDLVINRERVIINVCNQLKPKLVAEDQLLLLLRFMEFAHGNHEGLNENLAIFHQIAAIFNIDTGTFDDLYAFVAGKKSPSILTVNADAGDKAPNHIHRSGLEGEIRVLRLTRFDRMVFLYQGSGRVFMNDIPLTPGIFYGWQRSGVIKSPLFLPVYYSDALDVFNRNERKERIVLTGREIEFRFKNSENGLHDFSFNLESGQLVAIMGGSGVGKSTLLSILNGNITPESGSVCLNGHPLSDPACKRLIGFVPQDDLLIEELTVFQNLWYTARLCFANRTEKEIEDRVNTILEDLDLSKIRDLAVGSPIRKTISGGQRKRLNIALELIREPAILYLDEPTSGLSSTDSEKVIMLLKEQTHRGRLVVVNIHQPSSEIYKLFDRLWLLDTGGYPIYDGNPIEAITYFKRIANYTDQDISVCGTCGNINPELILTIIDAKKIDDSGNQTNIRKITPQEWHELYVASRPRFQAARPTPLPPNHQRKPSLWKQFCIFLERNIKTKLTNKPYLCIALLETPLLAVIVALLTRFAPDEGYSLLANKNLVSYIFMAVIVATFTGLSISAEEIIKDRTLLKRERFLRLSRGSYLSSKMFYLLCISAIQSLQFIAVGNALIGIGSEMFLTWWITLWVTSFLANLTGLVLSQSFSSIVAIYITIPLLLIPQILLCGLVVRFDDLSRSASSRNRVPLIGEVIPSRWAFEALVTEQFRNNSYNRLFFAVEKEKFLAQYYRNIHADEVRDLVNSLDLIPEKREENIRTIRNELAVLSRAARIAPYTSGESYESYLDKVEKALHTRSDNFTALLEKKRKEAIQEHGSEWLNTLKKEHHNSAIEELVLNSTSTQFYKKAHNRIYPKIGQIYLEPDNNWGRAPFYSHTKKFAGYTFSTFTFNLLMLGIFALLVIISIFAEFPGRYLNKGND
ncbi:ATP-binding cassette domain-containing protein [Parabacteroides sp. ZJ-118]|uniref:ATP-binding cassette domain-containing protein n=1 Tax=Parabacteroides sp. ZJ-118 TaxID=2709398 RepID=UPI0013EC2D73|nr:ATP-binding cassette domain-containing protein [Parabacteroides sp. ZJ-118]